MTGWEKFKFEINRRWHRIKYRNNYRKMQEWNRQRIDKEVKKIITDRQDFQIWGATISADKLTEWELRWVLETTENDVEDLKRWFEEKKESGAFKWQ